MNFRFLTTLAVTLLPFCGMAQRNISPTESITISGKIKQEIRYSLSALDTFPKLKIEDQIIYNHKGEVKDTIRNIKGVLLKNILSPVEYLHEKPRDLNEFYFVFIASDGYKVVFSWNEIYNTEVGNNLYFITAMNGHPLPELEQRILFISTADLKSGRRYIKGLEKIEVRRVE